MASKNRKDSLNVAAVVAFAVAVGLSSAAFVWWSAPSGRLPGGGSEGHLSGSQLGSIAVSTPAETADGTLTFGGGSVRILVLMGPMQEGRSMYSFLIDNLTNPTLVFPQGTRVTMTVVNVDTDAYHGLMLT